jgi:hypothetical protein
MNEVKVFYIIRPRRYRAFIPEGRYEYLKAEGGLPAMRTKWEVPVLKGAFFKTTYRNFVFSQHANRIAPTSADNAKWARSPGSFGQPRARHIPGLIGIAGLTADLIRGALTDTTGLSGFIFYYDSDDGEGGLCMATAPTACVEEILASMPPERIDLSIAPK